MGDLLNTTGQGYLSPDQAMGAAIMAASGPSRLPVPLGSAVGQGLLAGQNAYQQALLRGSQAKLFQQEAQKNELGNELMRARIGLANQFTGGNLLSGQSQTGVLNPSAPDSGGYQSFARDAGLNVAPQNASTLASGAVGGYFDPKSMYQYGIRSAMLGDPQGAALAKMAVDNDPSIIGAKSAAEARGAAPYKALEALLARAGQVHNIGPGEVGLTGFQTLPDYIQNQFKTLLGGANPSGPSPVPNGAQTLPTSTAQTTGGPGVASTGFPTQPTRAPGGGIQSPISLEGKTLAEQILPEQYKEAAKNYQAAQAMNGQLNMIDHALDTLGTTGMASPGAAANTRLGMLKGWNTIAQTMGRPDLQFDPNKVGTWEDANKESTRMGFELAKSLGSREAQMIVQQAISAVPNVSNTPMGARLVSSSLRQAAQRQSDYYEFLNQFAMQHGGNTMGADVAFNKAHPPSEYTNRALFNSVPQNVMNNAPPEAIARLQKNPALLSDFLARYTH